MIVGQKILIALGLANNLFAILTINQNIHTQLNMNVKTHHYHMNYLKSKTNQNFSLNFVSSKYYLLKINSQKLRVILAFFNTLIVNGPCNTTPL
jgi:hypothetical protein